MYLRLASHMKKRHTIYHKNAISGIIQCKNWLIANATNAKVATVTTPDRSSKKTTSMNKNYLQIA